MAKQAPFLRRVRYQPPDAAGFPFDLKLLDDLRSLRIDNAVTFLAGENGCGKSTLIEALALASGAVAMGTDDLARDPTLEPARRLAGRLTLSRRATPRRTVFFRAEDAFGFTRRLIREAQELTELEAELGGSFRDGSWAQRLAMGTVRGQRLALAERYGEDPDARSHGESFLHLLEQRLLPGGLYFLDEPETPLSPVRQLALLKLLGDGAREGSQYVIASHSPMLMALPEAAIYWLDDRVTRVQWEDLDHVQILRSFLDRPERFLRRL